MNAFVQGTTLNYCEYLADLAVGALIDEVNLTPKPCLVDQRGSGVHHDLTLTLMERSARSLHPVFMQMAQVALRHSHICQDLREEIGEIGRQGEHLMMQATAGVNTHRGAIWALGLMVTASAFVSRKKSSVIASEICTLAGQIAQIEDRFIPQQQVSHGQYVQQKLGISGAKAQAQQGFPTIVQYGLPQLLLSRKQQIHEQFAQLDAMFAMMTHLDDTCVLYRSGQHGLAVMQQGAQQILDLGGSSTLAGQHACSILETELMSLNASAGGVADLLAATIFIDRVEQFYVKNK